MNVLFRKKSLESVVR